MTQIKWTPKSEQDLDEIRHYIAEKFNVDLAIEIVDDLVDTVESMLVDNPLCGSLLESNPLFSRIIYKGDTIYFCENPKDKFVYVVYVQSRKSQYKGHRVSL